jgi:hypothetical protein
MFVTASTLPNMVSINISSGTLQATTGITSAELLVTGLVSAANMFATTSTLPNMISTNITSATLNASTGITTGTLMVNNINMTPNAGDIVSELTFTAANNVTIPANVDGLIFPSENVRSFAAHVAVNIQATSGNLYSLFKLYCIQKTSGNWSLNSSFIGDNAGVTFSMATSGQVKYTSTNIPSFTSNTIKFEARTTSV